MVATDSPLGAIADAYHWKQVAAKVTEYVEAGAPAAIFIKKATRRFPAGAGYALLAPLRNELWVVKDNKDFDYSKWEKLACLDTLKNVHVDAEFPEDPEGWVYLKTGAEAVKDPWMVSDVAGVPYKLWKQPGKLIGGHNPITGSITGAALGGLAGYGAGKALKWAIRKPLKWLFPDMVDEEKTDWWAPGLAIAGGLAGGAGPLWAGSASQRAHGGSFLSQKISSDTSDALEDSVEKLFEKMSTIGGVGAMFNPTINAPNFVNQLNASMSPFELHPPKDAFGNPVISHAIQPPNPFGTRDPYGSRYSPMYTPAPAAGAMAGMVSGAAAARRSKWVSPMDVARVAWGAGAGALSGIIAGKVAGGLAGVNAKGQQKLKQIGLWGGLLGAAARAIF